MSIEILGTIAKHPLIFTGVALFIVCCLAAYAWSLWREVAQREASHRDKKNENNLEDEGNKKVKTHLTRLSEKEINESFRLLALSALQNQVEISEVCLRFKGLMGYLYDTPEFLTQKNIELIEVMSVKLKDFDTFEARKALSLNDRMKQDKARWKLEDQSKDEFISMCEEIYNRLKTN